MSEKKRVERKWWGDFEVGSGQCGRWRIGPLQLQVARYPEEWIVSWRSAGDPRDETAEIEVPSALCPIPAGSAVQRFVVRETTGRISLLPALADRPVIIKPETPLFVPSGEEVTLFVGSPAWVRVAVGDPPIHLTEMQAHRSSDTWAGPNTREGELCYSSRTLARRRLEDCTMRPHRAITALVVRNDAADPLLIEQVKLPAPMLALYATDDGVLWTESVTLVREAGDVHARLNIGEAVHPRDMELTRLTEPRQAQDSNVVFQAFNRLFGQG